MLRYQKPNNQESHSNQESGPDGLLSVLGDVTFEMGRGREVVAATWLSDAVAAGNDTALTFLAGLHLGAHRNGEGLAEAKPLLLEAASKGYAPAQTRLGFIFLVGLGAEAEPVEAAHWLAKAAEQGQKEAQSLFGMMLASGVGLDMDLPEAERLLTLAAQQDDGFAKKCLEAADLGLLSEIATFFIGMLRVLAWVGASLPDDAGDEDLRRGLVALASKGDADACLSLSFQYFSDNQHGDALRWCEAAAQNGQALAALVLGFLAFIGRDGAPKDVEAARWLGEASRQGVAPAQCLLGFMYKTGRGVAQDLPESIRLLEMATERMGDSSTLANLFNDPTKHSYLEVLLVVLGKMLVTKLVGGGPAEGDSAFVFHREALVLAQDGVPSAQFLSGLLYLGGEAIEKNMTEATRWFQKAAEQGHVGAQSILGIVLKTGDGVNQDMVEAARWFRKAADQGDAKAQFHIGFAFLDGEGVEQDTVEAVHWFRKAAEQDFEPAKKILNALSAPQKKLSEGNE